MFLLGFGGACLGCQPLGVKGKRPQVSGGHSNTVSKERKGEMGRRGEREEKVPWEPLKALVREMTWSARLGEALDKTLHRKPEAPWHHLTASMKLGVTGSGWLSCAAPQQDAMKLSARQRTCAEKERPYPCQCWGPDKTDCESVLLLTGFSRSPARQPPLPLSGQESLMTVLGYQGNWESGFFRWVSHLL